MGVLSAAAAIRNLPHTILILVSQLFEPCSRRCSVRPHTVRRPRLALGDGAATRVKFFEIRNAWSLYLAISTSAQQDNLVAVFVVFAVLQQACHALLFAVLVSRRFLAVSRCRGINSSGIPSSGLFLFAADLRRHRLCFCWHLGNTPPRSTV